MSFDDHSLVKLQAEIRYRHFTRRTQPANQNQEFPSNLDWVIAATGGLI